MKNVSATLSCIQPKKKEIIISDITQASAGK